MGTSVQTKGKSVMKINQREQAKAALKNGSQLE